MLDRGGDLLVRRGGGFREVVAAPLGLVREQLGQPEMRGAPFLVGRTLDHDRLDHRVAEPHLADPVVDDDQMVTFGGPELVESSRPAGRRQDAEAAGAVEHREQEQASRRLGEPLDPGLVQPPHLSAHPRGHGGVRSAGHRGELEQRQRIALRLVDDTPADAGRQVDELASQQLHRVGLRERRHGELRQPRALEERSDPGPDGTEQPDPAASQPPADEADHGTAGAVEPVQVVDRRSATARSMPPGGTARAMRSARRGGPVHGRSRGRARPRSTYGWTGGDSADRRTAGRRAGAGRRS